MTGKLKIIKASIILIIFVGMTSTSFAVENIYKKSDWFFGIYSSLIFPKYTLDFNQLPGVPNCCPQFTSGEGAGLNAGFLVEYREYAYNQFRLKVGFSLLSSFISALEPEWIVLNEKLYPASISHEINAGFLFFNFEPSYKYSTPVGLSFLAGINIGWLLSSNYKQKEILVKPENEGTFENGSRIRNVSEGSISGTSSFLFSPVLSVEYDFKLNEFSTFILTPSFSFNFGLNSLLKDEDWNVIYFTIGLNLRYNAFKELSSPLEPRK